MLEILEIEKLLKNNNTGSYKASDNYDKYSIIFVPCLMNLSSNFLQNIDKDNCLVIFGPRSGSKTKDFSIPKDLPPGEL